MLDRRLLLVTGKGGSGRSAVSAALAIRAARSGRRVLAVAMTEAGGLAGHFGVQQLRYQPERVHAGVWALAIERSAALDEYLHLQLRVPKAAPMGAVARGLSVFVDTVPGIRDVITIGKVLYETRSGSWDLVIADAPPTGQIMSYLRAPGTIASLVPAGRVQSQAAQMQATLSDAETTGLVMVALPEELPVAETVDALTDLAGEPLVDVAAVAANRVLPALGRLKTRTLPEGAHREAYELHRGLQIAQQEWLDRLPAGPRLPYLFGLLTPGEVAARLADEWPES